MQKYLDMTDKQQNFKNIFNDSNISEIIWFYKFCNKNGNIVAEHWPPYEYSRNYRNKYAIKKYKVLKNTQYLFYKDFYYLIKELYDASKTNCSSLINFKKYINNNILNNKNIDYDNNKIHNIYLGNYEAKNPYEIQFITSHFIKHKDYKSIKIKNCGFIIAQYLINIIKNKFDAAMLKIYHIHYEFWECIYDLHYGRTKSRKQFEKYIKIFYEILLFHIS